MTRGLAVRLASRRARRRCRRRTRFRPRRSEFVGRGEELALLAGEHGDTPRVSVIEGMPGVGKTALAVRAARMVAERYPDGMFYLNFHTHDPGSPSLDSAEALHRLLRMLNVPAAQIPDADRRARRAVAGPAEQAARRGDPGRRRHGMTRSARCCRPPAGA